ncbi:MAG: serine hydrolase domain-containing protein [Rhodococcus erythropolis]
MADERALSTTVADLIDQSPAAATAIAVFDSQGIVASSLAGFADPQGSIPVTSAHWWDLASLTKVLVTLPEAISLLDRADVSLDDPLATVWATEPPIPEWITLRRCLSHSAGFPPEITNKEAAGDRRTVLADILRTARSLPEGVATVYSDLGYILVGEMIRHVGGSSLEELLAAQLHGLRFGPVPGPAVVTERSAWRQRDVCGEVHDETACQMGGVAGHAGAFGTLAAVVDAARTWLDPDLDQRFLQCLTPTSHLDDGSIFGLGWWMGFPSWLGANSPSQTAFGASGFVGNRLWIDRENHYGLVVLSNRIWPVRGDRGPFSHWCTRVIEAVHLEMQSSR